MHLNSSLLQAVFLLAASVRASPLALHQRAGGIRWGPCTINSTLPIECANFTVPLDYSDAKPNATLNLELLKVKAVKSPSRGSILFNFGGPGLEVRNTLVGLAPQLLAGTSGHYDLIGFDPRCDHSSSWHDRRLDIERALFVKTVLVGSGNSSDTALGHLWAGGDLIGQQCYQSPGSKLKGSLINTAFVARDLMQVVDALGEDGLLRYWGFSYGTLLGQTVAAMFPDRMDKLVLDGVMNAQEYYHGVDTEIWSDTDATFSGFLQACIKAGEECALTQSCSSASELETKIYDLLYKLKYEPIAFNGTIVDYSALQNLIRPSLYSPPSRGILASALNGLLTGNMTEFGAAQSVIQGSGSIFSGASADESAIGIDCVDKDWRKATFEETKPEMAALGAKSKLLGDVTQALMLTCAQWPFEPNERYGGSFQGIRTKTPVLFIGNSFDPATSIQAAYSATTGFVDSVVLKQNGYGHCSNAQPSVCTLKAVQSYFLNGTLPKPETVCEVDIPAFSNATFADLLPALGFPLPSK